MDRDERLNRLLEALESSEEPLSGGLLRKGWASAVRLSSRTWLL